MNKAIAAAMGTAAAGAGAVGAVKYKQKKDMENNMYEAILQTLPADLSAEDKAAIARSITKGATEDNGKVEKLAKIIEVFGNILGPEHLQDVFKKAAEEALVGIRSEVTEVVEEVPEEKIAKERSRLELIGKGFVEAATKNELPIEVLAAVQDSIMNILIKEASEEILLEK